MSCPQLPVHSYFDADLFALERERIFGRASLYVGHEKLVPEPGDWHALAQENAGRVLLRAGDDVRLLSNVCRHRQAVMLGDALREDGTQEDGASSQANGALARGKLGYRGNLSATGGNIVCPIHRWTYDARGTLIGAPHFPQPPCLHLQSFPLRACHGLLFEGARDPARDMAALFSRPEFDLSDYVYAHTEVHRCRYNWKTFIEVYLEDYHVAPFHPGLGRFVRCEDLQWEFSDWYSLQRVGVHDALRQPGSQVYRQWHERLLEYRGGQVPAFGAIWVTYFPTHMIELYPHVAILSTLYPVSPQETLNLIEFYYPQDVAAFEPGFIAAQRAAYMETAREDDEIGERMDAGRKALYRRGASESGPYQSPMEDGMRHFHAWYRGVMGEDALA